VSPVKYELGFYIPEDDILHSDCRENLKSYIALTGWPLYRRRNLSPVRYELGSYSPEDDIVHSNRREDLKSYIKKVLQIMFLPYWEYSWADGKIRHACRGVFCLVGRMGCALL
jgi:hypothetical protein